MQSLNVLLLLNTDALQIVGRQIAFGMYELLKMCAANIHTRDDWTLIFSILEYVGAGIIVSKSNNIGMFQCFIYSKILFPLHRILRIKIIC